MDVLLVYLVLVKALSLFNDVCALRQTTFSEVTESVVTTCPASAVVFETVERSVLGCSILCYSNPDCAAVYHTESAGTCIGCRQRYTANYPGLLSIDVGTRYFQNDCEQDGSWSFFSGSYYKLYQIYMTYSDAKVYCEERCGYLVNVGSSDEDVYLKTLASNVNAYIGLELHNNSMVDWRWANDGTPLNHGFWGRGEPSNPEIERCVAMHTVVNSTWVDIRCTSLLYFVCEK